MKYTRFIIDSPSGHLYCHTLLPFDEFMKLLRGDNCVVPSSDGRIFLRTDSVLKVWEYESDYKPTDS